MQAKKMRSWIELGIFTGLLFLLVAIPYTIYLKATAQTPKPVVLTSLQPEKTIIPTPTAPMTTATPSASTTTTCLPTSLSYQVADATPAAYLFPSSPAKLCYPPQLPPFPFRWDTYHNYQEGYSVSIPTNWINKSTSAQGTLVHIYAASSTASSSAVPTVSFAWYQGADPLASDSAYSKKDIQRDATPGIVYTRYTNSILAIFPLNKGYLLLQASTDDAAFYAFEYMLDSLSFTK